MNTQTNKIFNAKHVRNIAVCSILTFAVALPATSSAAGGYWSQNRGISVVRAKVQTATKKVTKKVAAAPAKAKQRIEDVADKLNEIYAQVRDNQPLLNQLKDGPLVGALGDTMKFLQDNQADFNQFINEEGENFRDDVRNLLSDFIAISQDSPLARGNGKMAERMQKVVSLIDKLPPVFLYPMYKAVGPKIEELQQMVTSVSNKLASIPKLPPLMELYVDPMAHAQTMCNFVSDKEVEVHTKTIQAILKSGVFSMGVILDQLPQDLNISVTVVGGGGLTIASHPARAPFSAIKTILEGMDLAIEQYTSIGKSVCAASGLWTPQ